MRKKEEHAEDFDINAIPAISKRAVFDKACEIPEPVIKRLPKYFRALRELFNNDVMRVSSEQLSDITGVSASQLRQDLKYFGGLGQRGYGYNVKVLYDSISEFMGVSKKYNAVIIGAGNLASSLVGSRLLEQRGVWVKALFDCDAEKCGSFVFDKPVYNAIDIESYCKENKIDIVVICYPVKNEEEIYKIIKTSRVSGVWNFSYSELDEKKAGVPVINVCCADSLMLLTYKMSHK